jgi:hypothetical protein
VRPGQREGLAGVVARWARENKEVSQMDRDKMLDVALTQIENSSAKAR